MGPDLVERMIYNEDRDAYWRIQAQKVQQFAENPDFKPFANSVRNMERRDLDLVVEALRHRGMDAQTARQVRLAATPEEGAVVQEAPAPPVGTWLVWGLVGVLVVVAGVLVVKRLR